MNELGLEDRVFARLHTFSKSLASNGGKKKTRFHLPPLTFVFVQPKTPRGNENMLTFFFLLSFLGLAAMVGPKVLKEYLINYARPLIYSTFTSFGNLASVKSAYEMLMAGETVEV